MATVYARQSAGVGRDNGGITHVSKGEAYDDKHPVVRAHRWLFADQPAEAAGREGPVIERATRAPGERRRTPRKGPAES